MRILQPVQYFYPYIGGQEKYIYNLSKQLIRMGNQVDIITSNFPAAPRLDSMEGINIKRLPIIARILRNPIAPGFLIAGRIASAYDIIHLHNEHGFPTMIASTIWAKSRPYILTCHGQLQYGNRVSDISERMYTKTIARLVFSKVDRICVNSSLDRDYIRRIDPLASDKLRVVSNAVDPMRLEEVRKSAQNVSLPFQSPEGSFKILFVGRIIRRKGIEWLLKAVRILIKEKGRTDVILTLVGSGEDSLEFIRMSQELGIANQIHFMGEVSDEILINMYENSDLFVLPSLSEVCPTVLLEAMYFRLPVVSTRIAGIMDHFSDTAILVPTMDERLLAMEIENLLDDEKKRKSLSVKGRERILSQYTWPQVARKYLEIYSEAIES